MTDEEARRQMVDQLEATSASKSMAAGRLHATVLWAIERLQSCHNAVPFLNAGQFIAYQNALAALDILKHTTGDPPPKP